MTIAERPASTDALRRVDGPDKVTGHAHYSYEYRFDDLAYAVLVMSTIAKGDIARIDTTAARAVDGVLEVISVDNAPPLFGDDGDLRLFQTRSVAYRGQVIGAVVATTFEAAVEGAQLVDVVYDVAAHDVVLRTDHPALYAPARVNPDFATDTAVGDFAASFAAADVQVDATYATPGQHNNPMEPHATTAFWEGQRLTVFDSVQGNMRARPLLAAVFGLRPDDVHMICQHIGGGFGAKGFPRAQSVVAALAARMLDRPVKCAATRQQMFTATGYRTPTIQRVRLGATADGRLTSIDHQVFEQTSTVKEFAEQTAVATRHMYAAPGRLTSHRLVRLDVPTPQWMRAPGECPGMFALESAMDELALALGMDPVELRIVNEPERDPETGAEFMNRQLVRCLREGADQFHWTQRRAASPRREGAWALGVGVASSIYPARAQPSSARATAFPDGRWLIEIDAVDIGTGARTALLGFAAESSGTSPDDIELRIADSDLPPAMIAGGSMGTASWTWAIAKACAELRRRLSEHSGPLPADGLSAEVSTKDDVERLAEKARFSFGAQFVEVRANVETGEVRVPHMLGVFSVGRVINAQTTRSQLIGGMTMGLSMALMEESVVDAALGHIMNHDLAQYHVATNADIGRIDVSTLDGTSDLGPAGAQGPGEVGIVGTAAAIANAVHDATGVRIRDLPIRPDKLLDRGSPDR